MRAPLAPLADAIRVGGLAEIKAGRIIAILKTLKKERPGKALSLEFLRELPDDDVRSYLSRFNGVGFVQFLFQEHRFRPGACLPVVLY